MATYGIVNILGEVKKMYIQFLVEDISGERLINAIMKKYQIESPTIGIEYTIRSYKGIGGIPKGNNVRTNKSEKLLNDLPKRLRAFNVSLKSKEDASLFIVLDNDARDPDEFEGQLKVLSRRADIDIDHVFCIAIEEMEAWLLGDRSAIQTAYPRLADRIASKHATYRQDSICGTWEVLAEILTKNGLREFNKQNSTPYEVGKRKIEWAENIGNYIDIRKNQSPSFLKFIAQLDIRREAIIQQK